MKPILFNTEMVQALLAGRKTQTRRVVKPQPEFSYGSWTWFYKHSSYNHADPGEFSRTLVKVAPIQPDNILWVRETWKPRAGGGYIHRADGGVPEYPNNLLLWRPSIHMPREAARLFLRVTGVRAERIQEISEGDARAEGIKSYWITKEAGENADDWHESSGPPFIGADLCSTRREAYQQLWDYLNAKDGYGWDTNPWVWVYEFERVTETEVEG